MPKQQKRAAIPEFRPQTLKDFIAKNLPPKEPLIDGALYRRDRISLTGRRRHGKTTLLCNIALAGALGREEYLGFRIPNPFTTVALFLEDDATEVQEKLKRMKKGLQTEKLHLYTRNDFWEWRIKVDVGDEKFKNRVRQICAAARPSLVWFDNLGKLIGADYNNPKRVEGLMEFVFELETEFDVATVIAAHPRKESQLNNGRDAISLVVSPERFFEECMGSSHFINSTGSLWGIERDEAAGRTNLLLGTQRFTGSHAITVVEKDDFDWFERVDDLEIAASLLLNTVKRQQAWKLIPEGREFGYVEARDAVIKGKAMSSPGTFNPWWNELLRGRLVVEVSEGRYMKAKAKAQVHTVDLLDLK